MKRQKKYPESLLPACEGRQQAFGLPNDMRELYEELHPLLCQQVRGYLGPSCSRDTAERVVRDIWAKAAETRLGRRQDDDAGKSARHAVSGAAREVLGPLQQPTAPSAQAWFDNLIHSPSATQRFEIVVHRILEIVNSILGHPGAVDAEQTFHDLGLLPEDLRTLREQCTQMTGLPISPSSATPSSTPLSLARHLLDRLMPAQDDTPEQVDQFEAFYHGFHPRLRRYASHILGPGYGNDVDDVMQTVWIAVLGNWGRIRQMAYVDAYLFKVTRHESLRIRQATLRRYSHVPPTDDAGLMRLAERRWWFQPDEFDHVLQEEWLRRCIADQIAPHLSRQQLAILLLAASGYDTDVIADVLGVTPATIRVQRSRLRRKLQTVLPRALGTNG
ncbi:RNA polymerase sigma factor [Streptomyces sp. NPDC102394]|uniref:RNA polymerase sigma factor n=1 Tax=Streptomyces sp. NPDC102394 TaxID=3366167 RepID=UPI003826FF87